MDRKAILGELKALIERLRDGFALYRKTRHIKSGRYDQLLELSTRVNDLCELTKMPIFIYLEQEPSEGSVFSKKMGWCTSFEMFLRIVIKDPRTGELRVSKLPMQAAMPNGAKLDCSYELSMLDSFLSRCVDFVSIEAERPVQTIKENIHSDDTDSSKSRRRGKKGSGGKPGPRPRAMSAQEKRVYDLWKTKKYTITEIDELLQFEFSKVDWPYGEAKKTLDRIRKMAGRQDITLDELRARPEKRTTKRTN